MADKLTTIEKAKATPEALEAVRLGYVPSVEVYNKAVEDGTRMALNSNNLKPEKPIKTPTPKVPTETPALGGTIESLAKDYTDSVVSSNEINTLKKNRDTTLSKLLDQIVNQKGENALTANFYADEVDPAKKELDAINSEIRAEQLALLRKTQAIEKNTRGATAESIAQDIRMAEKDSYQKQADLSIIQMAKQNNYATAKEIADRKVSAALEDQRIKIDTLQFVYNENKELFNKQEQRQFETQQAERNRLLQKEETELKAVNDLAIEALKNGAPTSVVRQMQSATTQDQAIGIGGSYIGKLARETELLQQQNIRSQIADRAAQSGGTGTYKQNQYAAGGYAARVEDSSKILNDLKDKGTKPQGYLEKYLPNLFKSTERQQFEQAERNFINATLRRESGATITPEEFVNARKQYIPQLGDTPETLVQKQNNRNTVFGSMKAEAGGAYDEIKQQTDETAPPVTPPISEKANKYLNDYLSTLNYKK